MIQTMMTFCDRDGLPKVRVDGAGGSLGYTLEGDAALAFHTLLDALAPFDVLASRASDDIEKPRAELLKLRDELKLARRTAEGALDAQGKAERQWFDVRTERDRLLNEATATAALHRKTRASIFEVVEELSSDCLGEAHEALNEITRAIDVHAELERLRGRVERLRALEETTVAHIDRLIRERKEHL